MPKKKFHSAKLLFLTDDDLDALMSLSETVDLERGDVVVHEGQQPDAIYLIRDGAISARNDEVTVAYLGPGEVFGEMSFIEESNASASVIAEQSTVLEKIPSAALRDFLMEHPQIASRFYHSLSMSLTERLRETSHQLSRVRRQKGEGRPRIHRANPDKQSARLMQLDLLESIEVIRASIKQAHKSMLQDADEQGAARKQVFKACDDIMQLLEDSTHENAIVKVGDSEPIAICNNAMLRQRVGSMILRESFPILMTSSNMARCYAKPGGIPEDYLTMQMLYSNEPAGDGLVGPLVDAWFHQRSFCQTRRSCRDWMAEQLVERAKQSERPLRVANLASGTISELLMAFQQVSPDSMHATCIDFDPETIRQASVDASNQNLDRQITLVCTDALSLAHTGNEVQIQPQDLIYSLGFLEYLNDVDAMELLGSAWEHLTPGGTLVLTQLTPDLSDHKLLEFCLEWTVYPRDANELRSLLKMSPFGEHSEVVTNPDGTALLATAQRSSPA